MQYLDAMGIDTFVPRFLLPNAKLSLVCDLPFASVPQNTAYSGVATDGVATDRVTVNKAAEAASGVSVAVSSIVADILAKSDADASRAETQSNAQQAPLKLVLDVPTSSQEPMLTDSEAVHSESSI
ncbi:MAG: hypothetical protein ACI9Y1_001506, partial [Lentisphaeria bacterium]